MCHSEAHMRMANETNLVFLEKPVPGPLNAADIGVQEDHEIGNSYLRA